MSSSLQSSLGLGHLPRLFSAAMSCLLSPHAQVVTAAAGTLKVGAAFSKCTGNLRTKPNRIGGDEREMPSKSTGELGHPPVSIS